MVDNMHTVALEDHEERREHGQEQGEHRMETSCLHGDFRVLPPSYWETFYAKFLFDEGLARGSSSFAKIQVASPCRRPLSIL